MRGDFRLVRVREGSRADTGYAYDGYDKALVTALGAWVKLDGTSGLHEARVVRHLPDKKLLIVKHYGYTSYIDRGSRNQYRPAVFTIYEYKERTKENEIHLWVDLFGLTEIPLKWTPSL